MFTILTLDGDVGSLFTHNENNNPAPALNTDMEKHTPMLFTVYLYFYWATDNSLNVY